MIPIRQSTMSALNESLVLDYVREHAGTSRTAIAQDLGLSGASVSRIVSRLVRKGRVTESPNPSDGRGRPAARLWFDHRAGCVIAVDLGGTKCHGVLADLAGSVLVEDVRPTRSAGTPYETLLACLDALRAGAPSPLVAAAVGVPAIVHPVTGVVLEGPNVLWQEFPIVDQLRRALRVPFVVDNDVKLAALAQAWRGSGRGVADFVTMSIGTGVGAAIVANGEIMRGANNAAGEIGYLIAHPRQLRGPRHDMLGGLERVVAGPAIASRASRLLRADPARADGLDPAQVTSEDVFAAARAGHDVARQVIDETLEAVLAALIAITVTADPSVIILDGGVGRSLEPYLARLGDGIRAQLPWVPRLAVSDLGPNATVVGAIATALWLDRRSAMPHIATQPFAATGTAGPGAIHHVD